MRRLTALLPLVLLLVLAGFFWIGLGRNPSEVPSPLIDKPAPEFSLGGLFPDRPALARADLVGKVTLVNFFASWCGPCRVEHPMLMKLAREQPGVVLAGIDYKDKPEDARGWLAQLGDPYGRLAADHDGRVAIDWGVYGVPETYVVDKQGRIRFKQVGPMTQEIFDQTVLPLIKELSK